MLQNAPMEPVRYENKQARPFFAGILPEEGHGSIIARILGISETNDFALLEQIGASVRVPSAFYLRSSVPRRSGVRPVAWPELSTRLAMNIGHGKSVNDINPAHFRRMSEECGLGWPMVRERILA